MFKAADRRLKVLRSHAVRAAALRTHEFASVARRRKVGVLVRLGALFAAAHLALVERVARRDRVLVGGHRHADFALLEQRTSHRLLGLLAARRRIYHLLRLEQQLVDSVLALNGCPTAHPMNIIRVHWHLLWIDELVDHGFASGGLGVRDKATVVRAL